MVISNGENLLWKKWFYTLGCVYPQQALILFSLAMERGKKEQKSKSETLIVEEELNCNLSECWNGQLN